MNADAIHDFLRRKPFEPAVIRMLNGDTHDVQRLECAIVMRTRVLVYYLETCGRVYGERRSKSAARAGVGRPVKTCSKQLCSDVGFLHPDRADEPVDCQ